MEISVVGKFLIFPPEFVEFFPQINAGRFRLDMGFLLTLFSFVAMSVSSQNPLSPGAP